MYKIKVDSETFYLSEKTLRHHSETHLAKVLMGLETDEFVTKDFEGAFCIDCDPESFKSIVAQLRGNKNYMEYFGFNGDNVLDTRVLKSNKPEDIQSFTDKLSSFLSTDPFSTITTLSNDENFTKFINISNAQYDDDTSDSSDEDFEKIE